jgi:hypothetical protein
MIDLEFETEAEFDAWLAAEQEAHGQVCTDPFAPEPPVLSPEVVAVLRAFGRIVREQPL